MKHIIYEGKQITIRIRDVVIGIILLLLFFFCVRSCVQTSIQATKEDKIQDHCLIMKTNVNDLNALFKRSDLCSEAWFREYDAFIERLKEQEVLLDQEAQSTQIHTTAKEIRELQAEIEKEMQSFRKEPSIPKVEQLEQKVKAYSRYYHETCDEGDDWDEKN